MNLKGKIYYSEASFLPTTMLEASEINTVQPAFVDTPMLSSLKDFWGSDFDGFIKDFQPLGIIPVEDIVEQIRFLLNKRSTKVSGTTIFINAGRN